MKINEVIQYLDIVFHPEFQEEYDNSGFLVGDADNEYTGAIIAIDLTFDLIQEAIDQQCNLIVTHHPCIFGRIKRVTQENTLGQMIIKMIQNNICVYAAHTNLDNLKDGVNGILCQKLGIINTNILRPLNGHPEIGAGMIGCLANPIDSNQYLQQVKKTLNIPYIRTNGMERNAISKIAVCGGSGSFLTGDAIAAGADMLLTSDLKYHDFQNADNKIILADIGHYESEQYAKEIIYSKILEKFGKFACVISKSTHGYAHYI